MLAGSFGAAGNTIVIEEFLRGEEVSFIVVAARRAGHRRWPPRRITSAATMAIAGPNTGGMGAYSPAPIVTRRAACAHHARGDRADACAACARRHSLSPAFCTRG